jgi:hypothetical protein
LEKLGPAELAIRFTFEKACGRLTWRFSFRALGLKMQVRPVAMPKAKRQCGQNAWLCRDSALLGSRGYFHSAGAWANQTEAAKFLRSRPYRVGTNHE